MEFSPIAIVGRACVLPGALSPEALWTLVSESQDHVRSAPEGRWRTTDRSCGPNDDPADRAWSNKGGYVSDFSSVWDPTGFAIDPQDLTGLDPLFGWALHCAREALADAGDNRRGAVSRPRVSAVFGNLGFPSGEMTRYAEAIWHKDTTPPPALNRFMSSGAAKLLERALGLTAGAMCLDTACASSLYAIKLAIDQLHDGVVDLALAGAVNGADDLFIHVGFTALKAMSKSGQSRPFHAQADGLVPAEGAGMVALKRLEDARRDGNTIYGIIRGIGLSNDGRGRGFLAPSSQGQVRAIKAAYTGANLSPSAVSLLECHATGTTVGDATEIASTGEVYAACSDVAIGSLKSNMGHLITTAGVAGLIKVLEAIRHQTRPPTLHTDALNPALKNSPFRVLTDAEAWESEGPRVAAVSAFGFGGNNAHLIVSENDPDLKVESPTPTSLMPLAVIGLGTVIGPASNRAEVAKALFSATSLAEPMAELELGLTGLRFPPTDLSQSLGQQVSLLKAATEAMAGVAKLNGERTGVFVAMEPDVEVCRFGLRWRLSQRLKDANCNGAAHADWLTDTADKIIPTLRSAGVVGNMPNIPANRLNSQFDLGGASISISAGERSGLRTFAQAHRALSTGELDCALVGAVDLCWQSVHQEALTAIEGKESRPGDAAVVLVLKPLDAAEEAGDTILAVVSNHTDTQNCVPNLDQQMGRNWAGGELRDLAAHILTANQGCHIDGRPYLAPTPTPFTIGKLDPLFVSPRLHPTPGLDTTHIYRFAADTPAALLQALSCGDTYCDGPVRLAIVAPDTETFNVRAEAAHRHIATGTPPGPGVFYQATPMPGKRASVFSGAGSAYAEMGRPLLQAFPSLGTSLFEAHPKAAIALSTPWPADGNVAPLLRLWSASALCQVHAEFSRDWLNFKPDAVIGYSSGESNSLFSTGIWTDLSAMISDARGGMLFTEEIGGKMGAVAREWGVDVDWQTWTILAPVTEVSTLVAAEPHLELSVIHSDADCIIAGQADAAERVCAIIGKHRCLRLHYDLAVHVPALNRVSEPWLDLHRRTVTEVPDITVYSGGYGAAYTPSKEACAAAILAQANKTLDFRKVIEAAYADGVRIFLEHGPQASCSRWIRDILGDREALVVALDRKGGGLAPSLEAAAALWAASVEIGLEKLTKQCTVAPTGPSLMFKVHPDAIEIPPFPTEISTMQTMSPAPTLASISGHASTPLDTVPTPPPGLSPTLTPSQVQPPAQTPMTAGGLNPIASPDPVIAALRAQIVAMGQSEQDHIAAATILHQRFLAMTAQAIALFDATALPQPPQPVTVVAPVAPVAPVARVSTPKATPILPTAVTSQAPTPPAPAQQPTLKPRALTASPAPSTGPATPTGPTFDREQLKIHSSGKISEIFGPRFEAQDGFHRQVRMPEGLLLLADRITGLDAELGTMGKGTIWSETDVTDDAWYLHQGHIPAGVMIEAGQADLMLISYLGVDFSNQNDRVYRLLGCELTYHGGLPKVDDTLCYDIHMDGHATQGDVRLMFFHYDCRVDGDVRLSVTKGQAGFFTDAELADSDGCLWTPEDQDLAPNPRIDPPAIACSHSDFSAEQIQAFADGRPYECFGVGFERTLPHTRTPRIQDGRMTFLGPITEFSTTGGPWGRGYMKSTIDIDPKTWFFDGHFKNDPCMPGTLMFEGCLQLMAFYLSAMGYTSRRDGWRFEPVSGMPFPLSCRGQVTPKSKVLSYELFVEEVHDGPIPTLYADLLCTVDGLKAFHARRVALQLVPGWPLDEGSPLLADYVEPKPVAKAGEFPFDFRSLVACANGRPSEAFGPIYDRFDAPGRVARLPNPPYLFMSRITETNGDIGTMDEGMSVEVEYDIPEDAWYFDENGCRAMPFAVLLEAALQPCGWLASYLGCALTTDTELCFRNLDGKGTLHVDILPDAGTLVTRVKSTGISSVASMIIVNFEVECTIDKTVVYTLETVFGFFPQAALENQVGLPTTDLQRAILTAPANRTVDFTLPTTTAQAAPKLAEPMLLMIDRVSHFDPTGGPAGLGAARAEKDVNPGEWFFKAHFFQDPVQPGSLGIEAMIQLLQWTMREMNLADGIDNPRFETLGLGEQMLWKYRGQVIPENKLIQSTIEITEIRREENTVIVICDASLWVDAKRIYEAEGLGMRIVSGGTPDTPSFTLDPETDTWLKDHCPTWTLPALPMMSMVDALAAGACTANPVTSLKDVRIKGWLGFDTPQTLKTRRDGQNVRLLRVDEEGNETEVATAKVFTGAYTTRPPAMAALHGEALALPYESGALFHGEAFQILESLVRTAEGASSVLRANSGVPVGRVNPGLLDGATHGIPHDQLHIWHPELSKDQVAYPALIPEINFYGPTPTTGSLRCEVRPDGFLGSPDYPAAQIQLIGDQGVWCSFRLVEACFDKGAIGSAPALERRAFLRDGAHVDGLRTSTQSDGLTRLTEDDVAAIDWLPGTVKSVYGSREIAEIGKREHVGAALGVHPGLVPSGLPLHRFDLTVSGDEQAVTVTGDGRGTMDISEVSRFWSGWFDRKPWIVEDIYYGLIERFVGKVVLNDPDGFAAVKGKSLIYLGNHQVGVESLIFSIIASGLGQVPTVTLAKAEHRHTWLGKLIEHCFAYPGVADPKVIAFFDREDKGSLPAILAELAQEMTGPGRSVMVHIEGTRSLDCTTPVQKMSGAFLDMAMSVSAPVVPVRFVGALPRETMDSRIEFPVGMGRQDIYIGSPIYPEELSSLHYGARKAKVIAAINALGPKHTAENANPPDPAFAESVASWQARYGVSEEHAVLGCVLSERAQPVDETRNWLKADTIAALGNGEVATWLAELSTRIKGL